MNGVTGAIYSLILTPDGTGLFSFAGSVAGGLNGIGRPSGFGYVNPGSPVFSGPTMLVDDYVGSEGVAAYSVDSNGIPIGPPTTVVTGISAPAAGRLIRSRATTSSRPTITGQATSMC